MYFTILNTLLGAFFLFLIVVGIILKYWSYLPVNIVGTIVVAITLYLDVFNRLTPGNILLLLLTLVVIFIADLVFIFRDFKEEVTEVDARNRRKYLVEGILQEHYKLIRDVQIIKNEIEKHKDVPISDRIQATEMLKLGNVAFIEKYYREALEKYDLSISWIETGVGLLNKSGVLLKLRQFEDALVMANKASEIQPKFYEALLNQGVALEKLKQYETALSKYKAAAKISPVEYEVWFCCANVLFKMNKFKESIEFYNKSLNLYERQFEAWYYKGIAFQKIGKQIEALFCFEQAIKIKSNHAKVFFRSGNILCRLNRDVESIAAYEKSININPDSVETWNNLGVVLNKIGHIKDAIKCYDRAIKINPEYYEAWLNKGLILDTIGQYKKAYISYKKFVQIAPKDMEKRLNITRKRLDEIKTKYKIKEKKKAIRISSIRKRILKKS